MRTQIPCKRTIEGCQYTTYAGYMVNKAIALFTNQRDYRAEDTTLTVTHPIAWQSLPIDPQSYESIFPLLFEASGDQSLYQTLLPHDLQRDEFLQAWIQDNTVREVLARLTRSETVQVEQIHWFVNERKVRDVLKKLNDYGWYLVRTRGDHRQYKHDSKPVKVTVPGHPRDDLNPDTLLKVSRSRRGGRTEHERIRRDL